MSTWIAKIAKIVVLSLVLGSLYLLADHKHQQRNDARQRPVALTAACTEKLARYGLAVAEHYSSPYALKLSNKAIKSRGYGEDDVRAIQRGCNIIDDTQGQFAKDIARERWSATRFIRGTHVSCDHCHQSIGDKQDAARSEEHTSELQSH